MEPKKQGKVQVLKFGGTSVKDLASMKLCAQKVMHHLQYGPVAVVVSATAGTTDKLLQDVESLRVNGIVLSKVAADMIITTGENISAGMFSGVLEADGIKSVPMCAWQLPIMTKGSVICGMNVVSIVEAMQNQIVPVITGFQGIESNTLTALDRGGSDISAVCVAKYLGLDTCYIYTDVPGVYRISPKLAAQNDLIEKLNYEDAYELAAGGAKVIHKEAVRFAQETNMKIVVLSTFAKEIDLNKPKAHGVTEICSDATKQYGITYTKVPEGVLIYVLHNNLISVDALRKLQVVRETEKDMHILFASDSDALGRFEIASGSITYRI